MPDYGPTQSAHDFNPNTGLSREQYRDMWMGSGISNIDQMQQWLNQYGGSILSGNGTVQTPYGDTLDMGTAFRTGNGTPGWTTVNPSAGSAQGSMMNSGNGQISPMTGKPYGPLNFQPQSQMPYNPYAGNAQSQSNYFQQQPMQQMQSVQTDGTLLGTQPSSGAMNRSVTTPNNFGPTKPSWNRSNSNGMGSSQPIGSAGFYGSSKPTDMNTKPLPNNNFMG